MADANVELSAALWAEVVLEAAERGMSAVALAEQYIRAGLSDATTGGSFQVDLQGVVDLLSNHLYSGPSVFIRELLQNAVDAIVARCEIDPDHEGQIRLEVIGGDRPTLVIEDNGIGLTAPEVRELLSTVGRSSKRDELDFARTDFIGQFGVGLLSAFLVSDEIVAVTTSARNPDAVAVEWHGRSDGTYEVMERPSTTAPGTTVYLRARQDQVQYFAFERIVALSRRYGQFLSVRIEVTDGDRTERIDGAYPWERSADQDQLLEAGSELLERRLIDVIEIEAPASGARGLAYVLAESPGPHTRPRHRVYLKRMLVGDDVDVVLPEWAFFVSCILEVEALTPTASREQLKDDDVLAATRDALGGSLKRAMVEMAESDPGRLTSWIRVHHLAMKALAATDDDFLDVVCEWLPVETTQGRCELGSIIGDGSKDVHIARTVETFRQVAPIAAALGMVVINGGYSYDSDIAFRLPLVRPGVRVREIEADELLAHFDEVAPADRPTATRLESLAVTSFMPLGMHVEVRSFEPWSLPALLVATDDDRHLRQLRLSAEGTSDLFGDILGEMASAINARGPTLCLNFSNPLVQSLARQHDVELTTRGIEMLYVQSLLLSQQPMTADEFALLNSAMIGLLNWGIGLVAEGDDG